MKFSSGAIVACAATLLAALAIGANAQAIQVGNRIIPASSIEHPNDVGKRAHTHIQILVGRGGGTHIDGGLGPAGGMSPAQLRTIYNLPSTGGSQIIAIVDAYDYSKALADFNTFSTNFGLPTETSTNVLSSTNKALQVIYANGVKPSADSTGGWELEEALDIEWAHAMAPNAKIILVEAASASFSDLLNAVSVATNYVDGNGLSVKEVSNSWGGSEFGGENSYDSYFTGTTATYFVAAGDSGEPAEYPSASPYVISAGGTSVATNASGQLTSETAWSSGGGGPSALEARPAYQNAIVGTVGAFRGTPDISFDADPNTGVAIYDSYPYQGFTYGWVVLGGTSVASPSLAGIANLAATAQGSFPAGSQALLTTIYSNLGTANFRDITSGSNGYAAGAGWDFVTGVGSCIGLAGLQSASGPPPPSIAALSPSSANAGSVGFTLTVNGSGFVSGSIVNWNGVALSTTYVSASQLTSTVPAADIASAGTTAVTVSNSGGGTSGSSMFTIYGPLAITTISPSTVAAGSASFTLTVNGSGFTPGATVNWNGVALASSFVSSVKLTATVPSSYVASAGSAAISVSNISNTSNSVSITVTAAPTVSGLSPGTTTAGGGAFNMTVNGSNFVNGSTVMWNGAPLTTTYVSSSQLSAAVPASDIASAGTGSVTVNNPTGLSSNSALFTITSTNNPAPRLTSLSPNSVKHRSAQFTMTITGANLMPSTAILWQSGRTTYQLLSVTYVSSTTIKVVVPAQLLANRGSALLYVANPSPGGGDSNGLTFSID